MDQKKIGNFLRSLRKEKGLTQEQLADYAENEKAKLLRILCTISSVGAVH